MPLDGFFFLGEKMIHKKWKSIRDSFFRARWEGRPYLYPKESQFLIENLPAKRKLQDDVVSDKMFLLSLLEQFKKVT